jgi:hypothetical protein
VKKGCLSDVRNKLVNDSNQIDIKKNGIKIRKKRKTQLFNISYGPKRKKNLSRWKLLTHYNCKKAIEQDREVKNKGEEQLKEAPESRVCQRLLVG